MIRTKRIHLTPIETRAILHREARRMPALWALTGLALGATVIATLYGHAAGQAYAVLRTWLPVLGCVALWWVFFLWLSPWLFTRSKNFAAVSGPMTLAFSPTDVNQEYANGAMNEVPLAAGARPALRDGYAIIYGRKASMIIVPFDAFATAAEAEQVRQWLSRRPATA